MANRSDIINTLRKAYPDVDNCLLRSCVVVASEQKEILAHDMEKHQGRQRNADMLLLQILLQG